MAKSGESIISELKKSIEKAISDATTLANDFETLGKTIADKMNQCRATIEVENSANAKRKAEIDAEIKNLEIKIMRTSRMIDGKASDEDIKRLSVLKTERDALMSYGYNFPRLDDFVELIDSVSKVPSMMESLVKCENNIDTLQDALKKMDGEFYATIYNTYNGTIDHVCNQIVEWSKSLLGVSDTAIKDNFIDKKAVVLAIHSGKSKSPIIEEFANSVREIIY